MGKKAALSITEQEWFSPENYLWLISAAEKLPIAKRPAGRRKFRLLACAYCRRIWHLMQDAEHREIVEFAERVAEGDATMEDLTEAYRRMRKATAALRGHRSMVGETVRGVAERTASDGVRRACGHAAFLMADSLLPESRSIEQLKAGCAVEEATHGDMLRHVFGDPFRPVTLDDGWLTPAVLALARAAYDNRALPGGELGPARLAVLGDALEEAGCTSAEVLDHLRSPGPHVRGCWAVDLVLGKG
jgi:hypothetical protein